MAILNTSGGVATAASGITLTRPTGAGSTHRLLAVVLRDYILGTMQASSGWTQETIFNSPDFVSQLALWSAPGDVAALSFSSTTNSGGWKAACVAYSGRSSGALTDVDSSTTTTTSIAIPSLSAISGDDAFAVWIDVQSNSSLGSAPSGYTDFFTDTSSSNHFIAAYRANLSAGATGGLARTASNFTAKLALGALIAPAVVGAAECLYVVNL